MLLLEQRLFGSKRFLLAEKSSEVSAGAGVRELGRGFGRAARVLYVQVVHQEQLLEIHKQKRFNTTNKTNIFHVEVLRQRE